jgi:hypothetical protein
MSYRVKFQTIKGSFFHLSFTASCKQEATEHAKAMFPEHEIVDVAIGRCSNRPTFVR